MAQQPPPNYPPVPTAGGNVPSDLPDQSSDPAIQVNPQKPDKSRPPTGYPSGAEGYVSNVPPPLNQPGQYYPQYPGHVPSPYGPGGSGPPAPPPGYPGAGAQGYGQQPDHGPGPHVMGFPVLLSDPSMTAADLARERQAVLCGYTTLFLGICFPIFWIVGGFLPCCYPASARVRRVAIANSLAFIITTILVVVLPTLFVGNRRYF